jgi:hypothetical protein
MSGQLLVGDNVMIRSFNSEYLAARLWMLSERIEMLLFFEIMLERD